MDPTNKMDYNGDGITDIAVFREVSRATGGYDNSYWYVLESPNDAYLGAVHWGRKLDIPIPSDYDGDDKTDYAVYRWFDPFAIAPETNVSLLLNSFSGSFTQRYFGHVTGRKCSRDFTGDGNADVGELRRENMGTLAAPNFFYTFYVQLPNDGLNAKVTGGNSDHQVPVPEDYYVETGTRTFQSEIAVYDTVTSCFKVWKDMNSTDPPEPPVCLGLTVPSRPAPGDYNGDGLADYAATTPDTATDELVWTIKYNIPGSTPFTVRFGHAADIPVPGFYDLNAITDFAVVHAIGGPPPIQENWVWEIRKSGCYPTCPTKTIAWGLKSDIVLAFPYFFDLWY
jgi:hypothetical protein